MGISSFQSYGQKIIYSTLFSQILNMIFSPQTGNIVFMVSIDIGMFILWAQVLKQYLNKKICKGNNERQVRSCVILSSRKTYSSQKVSFCSKNVCKKMNDRGREKNQGTATLCFILIGKNGGNQIRFFCCNIIQMSHNVDA